MGDIKDAIKKVSKFNKGEPISTYTLTYDSQQNQLEPIYYWILDFIQDSGWKTEKIVDNFTSSPGSGHFSEMGQKVSIMQDRAIKMSGDLNQVIKSVLNLVYDLKEFKMRLAHYDDFHSGDSQLEESAMLALKQVWLDNVDMKRGRGAIHQLATVEMGYSTLREAFMMAKDVDDLKKMNDDDGGGLINDQVMRLLIPRISEFNKWIDYSEKELRKRFKIEQSYLKSQIQTIKMYSSWMKPYLKAAEDLKQQGFEGNAALVNAFSTSMFELTLLGKKGARLPEKFGKYNLRRDYESVVLINFKFVGHVSQRVTQKGDYGFAAGGRVDMTFDSYALNEEEMKMVRKEMEKDDISDTLKFSEDAAAEALDALKEDIDELLKDSKDEAADEKKKVDKKKAQDINPFAALFGLDKKKDGEKLGFWDGFLNVFKSEKKKAEKKEIEDVGDIMPDNYIERAVRAAAAEGAVNGIYTVYDVYKKVHGFKSSPEAFENGQKGWAKKTEGEDIKLKDAFRTGFDKIK